MNKQLFIAIQRLCPQHLLSRAVGLFAASENTFIKTKLIDWFIKRYNVDMSIAQDENPLSYRSFNAFFTRALKQDARPIKQDSHAICCPADGAVSQLGDIQDGRVFQAKGQDYSLLELTGGNSHDAEAYEDGKFATIYLSPRDYHRVHMPLSGTLEKMVHIPGDLFSVNTVTAENVPRLFARNERLVCHFTTDSGPMCVILVGAMIVASIETPWAGLVAPVKKRIASTDYASNATPIHLKKGDEMGRFQLGSTAIVLFGKNTMQWDEKFSAGTSTLMGEKLGELNHQ